MAISSTFPSQCSASIYRPRQPLDIRSSARKTHLVGNSSVHSFGLSTHICRAQNNNNISHMATPADHSYNRAALLLCRFGSKRQVPKGHALALPSRSRSVNTTRHQIRIPMYSLPRLHTRRNPLHHAVPLTVLAPDGFCVVEIRRYLYVHALPF